MKETLKYKDELDKKTVQPSYFLSSSIQGKLIELIKESQNNINRINDTFLTPLRMIAISHSNNINSIQKSLNNISSSRFLKILQDAIKNQSNKSANNYLTITNCFINNPQEALIVSNNIRTIMDSIKPIVNSVENFLKSYNFPYLMNDLLSNVKNISEVIYNENHSINPEKINKLFEEIFFNNPLLNNNYLKDIKQREIQTIKDSFFETDLTLKESLLFNDEEIVNNIDNCEKINVEKLSERYELSQNSTTFLYKLNSFLENWQGIIFLIQLIISVIPLWNQKDSIQNNIYQHNYIIGNPRLKDVITLETNFSKLSYYISSINANVRNHNNRNAAIICKLPMNHKVKVIDSVGYWMLVSFQSIIIDNEVEVTGWINKRHLRRIKNVQN